MVEYTNFAGGNSAIPFFRVDDVVDFICPPFYLLKTALG
jgi:hypothetical protein